MHSMRPHLWPAGGSRDVQQRDAAALHGDASRLLIVTAVEVAQLAHQLGVDEAVGSNQVVRQRGLAVIHVCQDAHVADARLQATPQRAAAL
jgi:5,10-methenyltetrahydromethanopterin hydrogenase